MKHKGYSGTVRFDDDDEVFHGEVLGLRDVVTFQGTTVEELKRAFEDSIEDYLDFCKERGEAPDKPFSGKFLMRIEPSLHRQLYELSADEGESLNAWVARRLEDLAKG
ncbi:MAG: type II toxin-antitoxin system HicB family antitoxin [Verrucomicrobiales bacterium]|nr:type II toxin-antitoxin system HicB family antitoxin [Verrucomicrobiales bacterium]